MNVRSQMALVGLTFFVMSVLWLVS